MGMVSSTVSSLKFLSSPISAQVACCWISQTLFLSSLTFSLHGCDGEMRQNVLRARRSWGLGRWNRNCQACSPPYSSNFLCSSPVCYSLPLMCVISSPFALLIMFRLLSRMLWVSLCALIHSDLSLCGYVYILDAEWTANRLCQVSYYLVYMLGLHYKHIKFMKISVIYL